MAKKSKKSNKKRQPAPKKPSNCYACHDQIPVGSKGHLRYSRLDGKARVLCDNCVRLVVTPHWTTDAKAHLRAPSK